MSIKKKRLVLIAVIIVLFIIILLLSRCRRAHEDFTADSLGRTPQNAFVYLKNPDENKLLVPNAVQKNYAVDYLKRYFAPWNNNFLTYSPQIKHAIKNIDDIKNFEMNFVEQFLKDPGYGINRLKNSEAWIDSIVANMAMSTFPNTQRKAITFYPANLRVLPTNDFSFKNWRQAGEGYPFDYMQESYVSANTPALILQTTRDGAWDLILINNDIGWMQSQNLLFIDDKFAHEWQTGAYVALTVDHAKIYDNQHLFRFSDDIGSLYPIAKQNNATTLSASNNANYYHILIAVTDSEQNAVIKSATIKSADATLWPLSATPANFAVIINHMLGTYYGWGGMRGYRDCSSTTMNLFATFGIWLPRTSSDQALVGNYISLETMSAAKKSKEIAKQAIPFLTLLKLPGHIVVYIGEREGKEYVFHDFWGVHTRNLFGQDGRALVGKSGITPLSLGAGFTNVPKRFIDNVQGMTVLGTNSN